MGKDFVWIVLMILLGRSTVSHALDWEKEIRRQERSVKVQYRKPPRTLASFLRHYPQCKDLLGERRLRCNQSVAKERYHSYFQAWQLQERQRQVSSVETGDMAVQLEKRAR